MLGVHNHRSWSLRQPRAWLRSAWTMFWAGLILLIQIPVFNDSGGFPKSARVGIIDPCCTEARSDPVVPRAFFVRIRIGIPRMKSGVRGASRHMRDWPYSRPHPVQRKLQTGSIDKQADLAKSQTRRPRLSAQAEPRLESAAARQSCRSLFQTIRLMGQYGPMRHSSRGIYGICGNVQYSPLLRSHPAAPSEPLLRHCPAPVQQSSVPFHPVESCLLVGARERFGLNRENGDCFRNMTPRPA